MGLPRASLMVVLGAGFALPSGCGAASTATSTRSKVQVSLIAPTDGARVAVSTVEVLGTVTPRNAVLRIAGKRVRVRRGAFKTPISLHTGWTRIRIQARAKGFVGSSMTVSVRYAPGAGGAVASTGAGAATSYAPPGSPSAGGSSHAARGTNHSGGGFSSGVSSLGKTVGGAIEGRAHGCGGSACGLIP